VLYLFHGTGDTEATWTDFGRAHFIIDNLLASKHARPMIVVMPDGHADLHEEEGIHTANFIKFEKDLLQSILPFVDSEYRTIAAPDGRSVCGLSMGGMQSLYIGLNHPETFAWVGGMSGYVPDAEKMCPDAFKDDSLNTKLKLLWHSIGKDDFLFKEYAKFNAVLESHHINRQFRVTEGQHEWHVWRQYLADFAPLLFR
jgi:enterochelin esterase family protein